jgi:serine/threonine-protein kinase RsbW
MGEGSRGQRPGRFELALNCNFTEVPRAREALRLFLAEQSCGPEEVSACEIALVEGCNNAIKYAGGRSEPVVIEVTCTPRQIELRITDHTPGFPWPEPAPLPEPDSESGRGIYLIQTVMDETEYLNSPGGNTLLMRKFRAFQEAGPELPSSRPGSPRG